MKDYTSIGLDNRLRSKTSISNRPSNFTSALKDDLDVEETPYLGRTAISKGTLQTTGGGLPQFRSTLGTSSGTVIMDVDPDTGTVTIRGGLVADSSLNLGTINNTKLAGTPELVGTLTNSRLINNGTWNSGTLGTPAITGGTVNSVVMGTPAITGGTITSGVGNALTIGSPAITNGTMNNATFGTPNTQSGTMGTPTIIRPTIDGTVNFDTSAGSATLGVSGDFAIQTHTGSAILVARLNGTTFFFASSGTLT